MHHKASVVAGRVDRRLDGEARRIDEIGRVLQDIAVQIDLHQRRRRDLLEQKSIGVDQEVMLRAGNSGRDVGVDQIIPAVEGHQPVERGEIDPRLPFFRAHLALQRQNARNRTVRHGCLPE